MQADQQQPRTITACIDGSAISGAVCDAAAWASMTIGAPLRLLHVLERTRTPAREDLSGSIGLGSREHLLDQLTELDEQRGRLALEHGKHMLEDARDRAARQGALDITLQQRHGSLVDALLETEAGTRLFVIGRLGEDHDINSHSIGSQVETVVRTMQTSILVTVGEFARPGRFMLAYDGSEAAQTAISQVAGSPLLKGMPGHVVMVGADDEAHRAQLAHAAAGLREQGHEVDQHLLQGNVVESLMRFRREHDVGITVMGAYGHSRFREFFVGSNTSKMISNSAVPLLLLR
jgi:nucleotide-binding universal stress UspA family protein